MISLAVARHNIGRAVTYTTDARVSGRDPRPPEPGTIERVGDAFVFVRYSWGVAATDPRDLDFREGPRP